MNKYYKMTTEEFRDWLKQHKMSAEYLSRVLEVTKPCVDHWITGRREVPATTVKLLRFFDDRPGNLEEFANI